MMNRVDLPLMQRMGEFSLHSFDEARSTVELVWTTGAIARQSVPALGVFDEELVVSAEAVRLDRLNAGAPLLDSHNKTSVRAVIGAVVPGSARLVGGKGIAMVQLSRAAEHAAIAQNIRDGILRNVSAGYRIRDAVRVERSRDDPDADIPLIRVTLWEPREISVVPIGADPGAGFRAESQEVFPCAIARDQGRRAPELHALRMRMRQRRHTAG